MNLKSDFLDEKVFLPFLLDNKYNSIDLFGYGFDCNDCRNYWLTKQNVLNRINDFSCLDGKNFNDTDNFKNCNL